MFRGAIRFGGVGFKGFGGADVLFAGEVVFVDVFVFEFLLAGGAPYAFSSSFSLGPGVARWYFLVMPAGDLYTASHGGARSPSLKNEPQQSSKPNLRMSFKHS